MRTLMRGTIAAVALSLAPVAVATTTIAPANAAASSDVASVSRVVSEPAAGALAKKQSRNIKLTDVSKPGKVRGKFRVTPNFERKRLLVQSKRNGKFVTTRKVKTNSKGIAVIAFKGSRNGTKYLVVAPGSKRFKTTSIKVTATSS